MKRFIDIKDQILDDECEFAFYCTVRDCFETFSGTQTWSTIEEFKQDYHGDDLERYLKLIPKDFGIKKATWNDVTVTLFGKEIKGIRSVNYEILVQIIDLETQLSHALMNEQYDLCAELKKQIDQLNSK